MQIKVSPISTDYLYSKAVKTLEGGTVLIFSMGLTLCITFVMSHSVKYFINIGDHSYAVLFPKKYT
jgi:hypothetical protein